jgi:hypothetical protein
MWGTLASYDHSLFSEEGVMQEMHLTCSVEAVPVWVNHLQQQVVDMHEDVVLIDWGCSVKRQTGYIVLCWASRVDQSIIAQLQVDPSIEDLCVYNIPEGAASVAGKGTWRSEAEECISIQSHR